MVQPPNLQRRPAKPALGNGRIQRAVRRAFYFGSEVTSSDIYDWVYPRRRHLLTQAHRHSARRVLMTMADPVERVPPYGAERELILARTGDGRARAKAKGVRFGRPPSLSPHQRREAIARIAEGVSQADLARSYGVSQATISRLAAPSPFGAVAAGVPAGA